MMMIYVIEESIEYFRTHISGSLEIHRDSSES